MDMDEKFASIIKRTKSNIMKKGAANHHNSKGLYYSFGNKGAFHNKVNSSVGQYSKKKITVKKYREILLTMADKAEKLCG